MKCTIENHHTATVIKFHGKITIGAGDVMLRTRIEQALEAGSRNIILDFEHVPYMDSSGIGELVAGLKAINDHNGKLALSHVKPKVFRILQLMTLCRIFRIFESNEEAMETLYAENPKAA